MQYYFIYFDNLISEKGKNITYFHYVKTDSKFNILNGKINEVNSKQSAERIIKKLSKKNIKIICFEKENLFSFLEICEKKKIDYEDFEVIELKILYLLIKGQLTKKITLELLEKQELELDKVLFFNRGNLLLELYKKISNQNDIVLSEYEHDIYSCSIFNVSKFNGYVNEDSIISLDSINLNAKKYLFFDIECSNCFGNKGKICEFSYIITDTNFKVLDEKEIIINPGPKNSKFDFHLIDRKTKEGLHLKYEEDDYKVYRESPTFDFYMNEIKNIISSDEYIKFGYGVINDINYLKYSFSRYQMTINDFCCFDVYSLLKKLVSFKVRGLEKTSEILVKKEILKDLPMHSSLADSLRTMMCLRNALGGRNLSEILNKSYECIFTSNVRKSNPQTFSTFDFLDKLRNYKETVSKRKDYIKFRNKYLENKNLESEINKNCYKNKKFCLSPKVKNAKDLSLKIIKMLLSKDYLLVMDENDADIYIFLDENDRDMNEYYFNKKYECLFAKDIGRMMSLYEDNISSKDLIKAVQLEREVEKYYKNGEYKKAYPIYLKIAKMGFIKYQRRMGEIYKNGIGTKKNLEKAKIWYQLASKKGDNNASYNLALLYLEEREFDLGSKLLKSIACKGYKAALESLGEFYTTGKFGFEISFDEAKTWYKRLVGVNSAKGYLKLGHLYMNENFEEFSFEKAFQYYELSAFKNDPEANFILGKEYLEGKYYIQNIDKAIQHLNIATLKGVVEANYYLGKIYFKNKLFNEAMECFSKVIDLKHEDTYLYLARMYENGWGIEKDIKTALKFYILSSDK